MHYVVLTVTSSGYLKHYLNPREMTQGNECDFLSIATSKHSSLVTMVTTMEIEDLMYFIHSYYNVLNMIYYLVGFQNHYFCAYRFSLYVNDFHLKIALSHCHQLNIKH